MRDFRADRNALERVLVPVAGGQKHVPLGHLATMRAASGPAMIRNEDGLLTGYVYVDLSGRDPAGYVEEAAQLLREKVNLPAATPSPGAASGGHAARPRAADGGRSPDSLPDLPSALHEHPLRHEDRHRPPRGSVLGDRAIWFLWLLGYNMSVGVWVGLIALLGIDAETGVFMLLYLDLAYEEARKEGRLNSLVDLRAAIVQGAAKRLRPKFMTVATTFLGSFRSCGRRAPDLTS